MKKNLSDYLIAISVIACSAVLLGALTFALTGWNAKPSGRILEADFPDVTGIKIHSEVRYAGAPAGRVSQIRYLKPEERKPIEDGKRFNAVRVTLALREGIPDIPGDTRVTISSDTMLSEKFVALSGGSPDQPAVPNGTCLQGISGGSFDELLADLGPFLKSVEKTIASLEGVVAKTGDTVDTLKSGIQDLLPRVNKVADSAKVAAESAETLLQHADKLIADNEGKIRENLVELRDTLGKLESVLENANGFVSRTDKQVTGRLDELSVVLQNLKVVTTQAKAITQTLGEKPSRLIWGGKPNDLPSEEEILRSKKPIPAPKSPPAKR